MSVLELMDLANHVMLRRWKRYLATVLLIGFLVFPNTGSRALLWYANERAEQIVEPWVGFAFPDPTDGPPAAP
jgi:hypothetical protein